MKKILKLFICLFVITLTSCEQDILEPPTIKNEEIKESITEKALLDGPITFTKTEIQLVAHDLGISFSESDAQKLANTLVFHKHDFLDGNNRIKRNADRLSADFIRIKRAENEYTWGSVIGGAIGTVVGGIIGAIAGPEAVPIGASIGGNLGAQFGTTSGSEVAEIHSSVEAGGTSVDTMVNPVAPTSKEEELIHRIQGFTCSDNQGTPLSKTFRVLENNSVMEDIYRWDFPRYRAIPNAGSIFTADPSNKVNVYYPSTDQIGSPLRNVYNPYHDIYKYIFVIVKLGPEALQMRLHPEDFYPDTINGNKRINHSQLSEGGRFAKLLGYPSMQVLAAGSMYIKNNQIIGLDSRTGHYYWGLQGKDDEMLQRVMTYLGCLGYDAGRIHTGQHLTNILTGGSDNGLQPGNAEPMF